MVKSRLEQALEVMKITDLAEEGFSSKTDPFLVEEILDELGNNRRYSKKNYSEYLSNQEDNIREQERSKKELKQEKDRYLFGHNLIHGEYE